MKPGPLQEQPGLLSLHHLTVSFTFSYTCFRHWFLPLNERYGGVGMTGHLPVSFSLFLSPFSNSPTGQITSQTSPAQQLSELDVATHTWNWGNFYEFEASLGLCSEF